MRGRKERSNKGLPTQCAETATSVSVIWQAVCNFYNSRLVCAASRFPFLFSPLELLERTSGPSSVAFGTHLMTKIKKLVVQVTDKAGTFRERTSAEVHWSYGALDLSASIICRRGVEGTRYRLKRSAFMLRTCKCLSFRASAAGHRLNSS